jgi:hypothetical protein
MKFLGLTGSIFALCVGATLLRYAGPFPESHYRSNVAMARS